MVVNPTDTRVKKMLVVYNPNSGRIRKERAWEQLQALLPRSFELERFDLSQPDGDLTTTLSRTTYNGVIAIGGDGTVRSVIEALHRNTIHIPVALIPRGTANLMASSLSIPRSLTACAELIVQGTTKAVDVARINGSHYFVGAFAVGYLSSRITAATHREKKLLGFGGYIVSFIRQTTFPLHTFHYTVDGHKYTTVGHTLFIVNTTTLLGVASKRSKGCDDGVFELVVTTNKSFATIPALIWEFYFKTANPKHFVLHQGKRFEVDLPTGANAQMDGEKIDLNGTAHIEVIARAQKFIVA